MESIGDSVGRNLLPIVAVSVLGAGPALVGALNSLGLLAFLVLALPLGVFADRWSRPTAIMTVSTCVRALAALGAVCAWRAGLLEGVSGVVLLIVVALVIGIADVGYTTGQALLVPRIVEPDGVRPVFGRIQSSSQVGGVVGSSMLSGMLAIVAAPVAWCASSAAYVLSALCQRGIRPVRPGGANSERVSMRRQTRAGIGHLMRQRTLRLITIANALNNAAVMSANTLLPVIVLADLGIAPATYALIGVVGAIAGIIGAASASAITGRIGLRFARMLTAAGMAVGIVIVMCCGLVLDLLPGAVEVWIGVQSAIAGFCASIAVVAGADLPPRLAPPEKLGAVMGAQRTVVLGAMPVAALAIGALGSVLGTGATAFVWLALALAAAVPCAFLPRRI